MEKKRRQLTPEQDALGHIVACKDKPFLEERFIDSSKGRGVFTHKAIKPSMFVVEYRGNIVSHKDTSSRKKCGDTLNSFLFEFSWKGAHWCVDASKDDRTLGRLVNDDHISPNCEMKKIVYEGKPHLCLFAVKEISPGEEITYNYGDSSYPWRSTDPYDGSSTSNTGFNATSSTPRTEGDSAGSSFEKSDDDELPDSGPSQDKDSFANTNSQLEDEAAFSPDELNSDEEYEPSRPVRKPMDSSYTCKNYCYVCGAGFTKIARHLLRHANEEPEIAEAFAFPKLSKERKRLLDVLRNRGNYKHNQEVMKNKSGPLKLRRRPTSTASAKTYVHCLYCKGMFKRKEMWRHVARCQSKTTTNSATGDKTRVLSEMALADSPFSHKLPSGVWKMLLTMNQDEIAFAVQNDFLIIQLAQYLCEKYRNNPNKHDYIRQKLREMGRLLLALHKKSVFSFEDAIKPRNFYKVVEAVKDIAGFNEKLQGYNKPSLALKLGHSLKKIGTIVLSKHDGNEQMKSDAKTFMKLCAKEWSELVSHTALASLSGQKVNNPSTIPFTRDVQVFYKYLETTSASATENLTVSESPQVYSALCRVILAQASVLNKCAPEVSKMTLKTFQERDDATRVLSKHFIRINIEKMTGQNVPVLLTSDLVSALTLLVSKRKACGVHQDNPYLFAKPDASATSHFHGRICIRAFSRLCRAKNPEHLRSVHLHKHIARVFQILNLENDELNHLAKLLGHDIRADRDYYRLPEAAVDLAKIAKLLLAMEKGSLERFKGNSLEEIEIEDELEPDVEQGNPENSDAEEENEESDLSCQQSDAVEQEGTQLTPEQDALEHIKACRDKGFLEERFIDPIKGRGVFTHQPIEPSTFVAEYRGIISAISHKETRRKKCGDSLKNYLFDFSWIGTNWRVDASKEDGTLGRLVNDDHISPNCEMRKVVYKGKPHLCLFAVKEISPGEEITYNYGESSYPWRSTAEDSAGSSTSAESCSDDDYVPEGEPSSDDGSKNNNPDPDSSEQQSFVQQPVDASCIQQDSEDDYSSDDFTSDGEPEGTSRTNKNYCYVCGKAQSKISRHLFTHRNEEDEIAEVFALPLYSKERNILLDKLRNRGNYKHNQMVLKTHCGELKVKRRKSNMSTAAKTYALCLYCKGMYSRKDMWRHMQRCASNKSSKLPGVGKTKVLTLIAAAESTDLKEISSDVREVLTKLKKDEIASVIESDPHILLLAQCLCHMNEGKTNRRDHIPHRLRLMGRLLLKLRTKSISSFEDAVKPENFSKVVEAVRELAGFNEEIKSCDRPSLMLKMGNSLKKIGQIIFARALKAEADEETTHEAETFMKLCAEEWSSVVKSKSRVNKPQTMSFIQDVQLFYQCVEKTAASAVESLTMYESPPVYNALLRVTAAQVSLLNRNNVDVSKVTIKSFKERDETELHEDAAVYQSQFEQILSKNTVKINLRNDKDKKVAVTLTPKLLSAITLLVNKREACGVHNNNPFLFARPVATCTSFYHGHQCINTFVARCGAKNPANLRSTFFRRHVARVFQILSLTNDELDQLARLLGRDIRTDSEYYQTPEAAVDIAKILELLSAMENECLERFEGKSLEEIEVADELELDVEHDSLENSDAEENEEPESSFQLGDVKRGRDIAHDKATTSKARSSFSRAKKPSGVSRVSSVKKRGRGRTKRYGGQDEESEPNDEKNDEVNTEKDDGSEEMPASCAVNTPEETLSRSKEDAADICFSDYDEDMNVDFDMDTDEDIPRNEDGDGDTNGSAATPKNDCLPNRDTSVADLEETMDTDTENHEDEKKGSEQNNWTDVDSRSPSAIFDTGKKNKLSAAVTGMKEVKILIPKLDIEKLQTSVHISQLSSVCNSVKWPVTDQPIQDNSKRCLTSSTATDINKPSFAKAIEMTCSHCKVTMLKGQTAYQKKGFTDVFCSKNCLFEMFPINKPVPKTCHHCHKAISQPLDLIMAAVDVKGTMKDFCSVTCLTSFKSPPQSSCSMCNKSCTTTCELTLNKAVHKFCSDSCLENFRRDNVGVCENCSSSCYKPLMLMLEEETKTICKEECLEEFKEVQKY
ncbi:uncharacterized protein LOC123977076 [Micropterus dolomieu]|uniref:uncharacterized protein LOC123977076 n=1 Tax=Micropterus dolomieu TaxID=147949 RepID=UPI001E8EB769|nr:uncharacterized protein LOC123977076 [Micropterus dolomieu]